MSERPREGEEVARADESSGRLARTIATQKARRDRARREPPGALWRHVARVGTLGWVIVLPIAAGALVGHLLDRALGTGVTWALAMLLLGVGIGGYSLWRLLAEEDDR